MTIDPNNIDYSHAKEVYNKLMAKTDLLSDEQNNLMSEASRIQMHKNIGLETSVMLKRLDDIEKELGLIKTQLTNILKDIRFMRRMTELNLPVNFN